MCRSENKPSKLNIQKKFKEGYIIKSKRNLFKLKNENEAIKDSFEQQGKD